MSLTVYLYRYIYFFNLLHSQINFSTITKLPINFIAIRNQLFNSKIGKKTHKFSTLVQPFSFCFHFISNILPLFIQPLQMANQQFYFNFRPLAPSQYSSHPFLTFFVTFYVRHNGKQLNWLSKPIKHYLQSLHLGAATVRYTILFRGTWMRVLLPFSFSGWLIRRICTSPPVVYKLSYYLKYLYLNLLLIWIHALKKTQITVLIPIKGTKYYNSTVYRHFWIKINLIIT